MNTKQLLVAAGLMLLATACKEDDTIEPVYTLPMSGSSALVSSGVYSDSVYTTEGKSGPVRLKLPQETPTSPTQEVPTPKQDVMPVQLPVDM